MLTVLWHQNCAELINPGPRRHSRSYLHLEGWPCWPWYVEFFGIQRHCLTVSPSSLCSSRSIDRLYSPGKYFSSVFDRQARTNRCAIQRVVVLKDQSNKKAHEDSAQLACEAAASIRTVASLTREEDCLRLYSESLEEPMQKSNRTAVWSNGLYSLSQSFSFFVIALVFWYGSRLVSFQEFTTVDFFIGLMASTLNTLESWKFI